MIEPRIYRAALLPALVAVLVAMFSVESRPAPLPRGLAADELFDPGRALSDARALAARQARAHNRAPARAQTAQFVAESFATSDFETRIDRFEAHGERLANVIGRRPGTASTKSQIVLVAARDGVGAAEEVATAADTAALLELARALEGRASRRTVTLVSLDGARLDEAGARRLAGTLDPARVEAVLVVSSFGARGGLEAPLVHWSNDAGRPSARLERTTGDAVRQELGSLPGQETVPAQLVRLAFPLGLGPQGVVLAEGVQAIRFSGSGELPSRERSLEQLDERRYGALGRAVLRTISALDGRGLPAAEAPTPHLTGARQLIPGWSVALVAMALLLPALVTVADGFARVGRRRRGVGAWMLWTLAGALSVGVGYLLLRLLDLIGVVPGMAVPAPPGVEPVTGGALALLAALLLITVASWVFGRRVVVGRLRGLSRPSTPAAGAAVALVVCVAVLGLWAVNPLAALFFVPAVHLWSAAAIAARPRPGVVLAMAGLVLPLAAAIFYLERLEIGPLHGIWYATLLVAGGHVGTLSAVLGCMLTGAFLSLLAVLTARAGKEASTPPPERPDQRLRGPLTYAGPGSLGGTRSALRR